MTGCAGATQFTSAEAFPAVAITFVGAAGGAVGMIRAAAVLGRPPPGFFSGSGRNFCHTSASSLNRSAFFDEDAAATMRPA